MSEGRICSVRRLATEAEEAALDAAAADTVARFATRGVSAEIVSERLNRRKIDVIPEPEWADPPKARISELLAAVESRLRAVGLDGLREGVGLAEEAARNAGLPEPRVTSDAKHIEIGLTDKADSARWIFGELWRRGIGPAQVLVAGDEFGPLGGLPGSDSFLLPAMAERAVSVSVGREPTGVPRGVLALGGGPEGFLAIAGGPARATEPRRPARSRRGQGLDDLGPRLRSGVGTRPLVIADDCRRDNRDERKSGRRASLCAPEGSRRGPLRRRRARARTSLPVPCGHASTASSHMPPRSSASSICTRVCCASGSDDSKTSKASSSLRSPPRAPRCFAPVASVLCSNPISRSRLQQGTEVETGIVDEAMWTLQHAAAGGLAVAAAERVEGDRLERLASYVADPATVPDPEEALRRLGEAQKLGFDGLLSAHRQRWAERWETADIRIEGDDELQQLVRFALFHLMGSAAEAGEAAVGARGLTGPAYRGHVFWDADVFVLPFLAATDPPAARAMLEYRLRRLDAARAAAAEPRTGGGAVPVGVRRRRRRRDPVSCPRSLREDRRDPHRRARGAHRRRHRLGSRLLRGLERRRGVRAPARAASSSSRPRATGPRAFASTVTGRAHIYGVIGPDEYHEPVDDNAFTNVMARWNLRRAAEARPWIRSTRPNATSWLELADCARRRLRPGHTALRAVRRLQPLEPLVIADIVPHRPIAADLLLGHERVHGAQVAEAGRRADAAPSRPRGGRARIARAEPRRTTNREPRTAARSHPRFMLHCSLGPAVSAQPWTRCGWHAGIDVDDLTGTTAGGVHLATMGGVWQALVFGFAGARASANSLDLDPRLPDAWDALEVRLKFHGYPVRVRFEHDSIGIDADPAVPVSVRGWLGRRFERRGQDWKEVGQ